MEKTAAKTYKDPALNKIIQEKAAWNKQVSALINDLIHFKKSMNGWPSKYYKERTRITQPVPVDLSGILSQIAGEFQDIASRGNGILTEQAEFSKSHLKKKTDQTLNTLERLQGPTDVPKPTAPPTGPDLSQQLGKGASQEMALFKLASDFEDKYFLEVQASNPFTRFITKLFTPKFGFGEGARIRRLRMTMLDSCVKTLRTLKQLHKEIVKSNKKSVVDSHKMMTLAWNYWNIVNRLYSAYNMVKPGKVEEQGGRIEDEEAKREREAEERGESPEVPPSPEVSTDQVKSKIEDFKANSASIGAVSKNPQFGAFVSILERLSAMPKSKKMTPKLISDLELSYNIALAATNQELGTQANSFQELWQQYQSKSANPVKAAQLQELRKVRHQILPGATSGSRLEIYNLIEQIRKDLDKVMDLLESGFDQKQLTPAIGNVNRGMTSLRTMIRSLYYSEKPEEAPPTFF